MRARLAVVAAAALLLVPGCSSNATSSSGMPASSSAAVPSSLPTSHQAPPALVSPGTGGNGAPVPGAAGSSVSRDMLTGFGATFSYESQSDSDIVVANQPMATNQTFVYEWGWAVCQTIRQGNRPILLKEIVAQNTGFTPLGAEALIAAALRKLCPDLNQIYHYTTLFDADIARAQELIKNQTGIDRPELDTGYVAKRVCNQLRTNPKPNAVNDQLIIDNLATAPAVLTGVNLIVYKSVVRNVAQAHCSQIADNLGGYWTDTRQNP